MKRAYTKPDVAFESFSLCASIAAGCEVKTDLPYSGGCGFKYSGYNIFLYEVSGCGAKIQDGTLRYENDFLCYHVPSESCNLFDS